MKQKVAPTCLSIKIVTVFIFLLTVGMFVLVFFELMFLSAAIALAAIIVFCYFFAPIAYELNGSKLAIVTRISKKTFGPVIKYSTIHKEKPSFGIRLWGNGGLFAGTGIFWNKKYGIFRAYVTTSNSSNLILVDTPTTKILISPENPDQFVTYVNSSNS